MGTSRLAENTQGQLNRRIQGHAQHLQSSVELTDLRVPGLELLPRLRLPGVDAGEDIVAPIPLNRMD